MDYLKILKDKGYKLTTPRKLVLEQLSQYPLTITEIAKELKNSKVKVDLVSIYRTLELFVVLEVVHAIEFGDGKKRYELIDNDNHHHHFVCDNCGNIEDILLSTERKMIQEAEQKSSFKVNKHSLEFFGLCKDCQNNNR